jgi:hypothetical protein
LVGNVFSYELAQSDALSKSVLMICRFNQHHQVDTDGQFLQARSLMSEFNALLDYLRTQAAALTPLSSG